MGIFDDANTVLYTEYFICHEEEMNLGRDDTNTKCYPKFHLFMIFKECPYKI